MKGRALRWAGLALAGAALVFAVVLAAGFGADPGLVDSPLLGKPAPSFDLEKLDGSGRVALDDLSGDIVVVNFFASWCPPCQQETPILRELAERYRDDGLEVIGISVQETSPEDLAAYAERYDLGYTIGFDASGHIFRAYRAYALPTQLFIDPNGAIVTIVNGPVDEQGASALIESLLPDRTSTASPSP